MTKEALYKQIRQEKGLTSDAIPAVLENKLIQELNRIIFNLKLNTCSSRRPSSPATLR